MSDRPSDEPRTARGEDPVQAAGGLVWRAGWLGARVALVHRHPHGHWTLPNGKREPGEELRETALREVREETGCAVVARGFAGRTRHTVHGRPKEVSYWHMEAVGVAGRPDPDEVDEVRWLRPAEALRRLSYPNERELLARAGRPRLASTRWRRRGPEHARLTASIVCLRTGLDRRPDAPAPGQGARSWKALARELLDEAEAHEATHDLQTGWRALKAAARLEVYGLSGDELAGRADSLLHEAERKLSGWRLESVRDLLSARRAKSPEAGQWTRPGSALRETPGRVTPDLLHRALFLRDEHGEGHYYMLEVLRHLLRWLLASALGLTGLLVVAGWPDGAANGVTGSSPEVAFPVQLLGVLLAGTMGGAWSALRELRRSLRGARIPYPVEYAGVPSLRPAVGAVGALLALLLARSGLLDLGEPSPPLLLVIAFAAGFSESWILSGIDGLTGSGERSERA